MSNKGKMLKKMDNYIRNSIQDDDLFLTWLVYVPDEASDADFDEISEDQDSWLEALEVFADLVTEDATNG